MTHSLANPKFESFEVLLAVLLHNEILCNVSQYLESSWTHQLWRQRHYDPSKRWWLYTSRHGVSSQNIWLLKPEVHYRPYRLADKFTPRTFFRIIFNIMLLFTPRSSVVYIFLTFAPNRPTLFPSIQYVPRVPPNPSPLILRLPPISSFLLRW